MAENVTENVKVKKSEGKKTKVSIRVLCFFIGSIILALADQFVKYDIVSHMKLHEERKIIGDIFVLHYLRNTGSAWGMFSKLTGFLVVISFILMIVILYVYKNIQYERYTLLRVCLCFIFGGAIGNMIDRIRLGYVVDYLYFKLIDFPVFNLADIFVTVPMILVFILLIFKFKSNDMDVILGDKYINEDGEFVDKKAKQD